MKKEYIAPEIDIVRLQCYGSMLIGSLSGGEVGAPEMPFDDIPSVPGVPSVPGLPGMPSLGPSIPEF